MRVRMMNFRKRSVAAAAALVLAGLALSGCVVYPSGYGYNSGYGYAPSYYAAPPVFGGVYVGGGGYYGGRWR